MFVARTQSLPGSMTVAVISLAESPEIFLLLTCLRGSSGREDTGKMGGGVYLHLSNLCVAGMCGLLARVQSPFSCRYNRTYFAGSVSEIPECDAVSNFSPSGKARNKNDPAWGNINLNLPGQAVNAYEIHPYDVCVIDSVLRCRGKVRARINKIKIQ